MDVEGGIPGGEDYAASIERLVHSVDAMVVVIGRHWFSCTDARGRRRLDNEDDWVRGEIAVALERDLLLLPVLVDGASMPREDEMPTAIRLLARRQASEISDRRWNYDVGEIIQILERVVTPSGLGDASHRESAPLPEWLWHPLRWIGNTVRWVVWGFLGLIAVLVALLIVGTVVEMVRGPGAAGDYSWTVDPPQVRLHRPRSSVEPLAVELRVSNSGTRAARFRVRAGATLAQLSPGVLTIDEESCKTQTVLEGKSCTVKVVFNPKWMNDDEQKRDLSGELEIWVSNEKSHSIPLTIRHAPPQ
jgi:hypothetical protein